MLCTFAIADLAGLVDGRDMVPWMLRWMEADLPARLGRQPESVDRFYELFDFCARQADLPAFSGMPLCFATRCQKLARLHIAKLLQAGMLSLSAQAAY